MRFFRVFNTTHKHHPLTHITTHNTKQDEKRQLEEEVHNLVTKRSPKFSNFIEVRLLDYHTHTHSVVPLARWTTVGSLRNNRLQRSYWTHKTAAPGTAAAR
jgi:hypothetical protein